jgi:hypothetical protein
MYFEVGWRDGVGCRASDWRWDNLEFTVREAGIATYVFMSDLLKKSNLARAFLSFAF